MDSKVDFRLEPTIDLSSNSISDSPRHRTTRIFACLFAFAVFASAAGQQTSPNPCKSIHSPVLTTPPDANAQMEMRDQESKQQNYTAANTERKKQISDDSTRLLKLATELKSEVDKTTKDTLSLNVIRKAEEIERLAHDVKEKMKLSASGN